MNCEERGALLADVWMGYTSMMEAVLCKVETEWLSARDYSLGADAKMTLIQAEAKATTTKSAALSVQLQVSH